jgi:hypothetical protein
MRRTINSGFVLMLLIRRMFALRRSGLKWSGICLFAVPRRAFQRLAHVLRVGAQQHACLSIRQRLE